MTAIALRQIRKTYGSLQVIHDVDIDIGAGTRAVQNPALGPNEA
ncbi:hypothetical protein [Shinella sp. HZN7]|nr:hypothetical protein [Shinella sp. HZN7]